MRRDLQYNRDGAHQEAVTLRAGATVSPVARADLSPRERGILSDLERRYLSTWPNARVVAFRWGGALRAAVVGDDLTPAPRPRRWGPR